MISLHGPGPGHPTRRWLVQAPARLARLDAFHRAAGRHLKAWVAGNLASGGALGQAPGGGWPPLRPATLAARRRLGLGSRPLIASGALLRGTAFQAGPRGLALFNPVAHAPAHQFGRGVPARPFFPTPAQAAEQVWPLLQTHLEDGLR